MDDESADDQRPRLEYRSRRDEIPNSGAGSFVLFIVGILIGTGGTIIAGFVWIGIAAQPRTSAYNPSILIPSALFVFLIAAGAGTAISRVGRRSRQPLFQGLAVGVCFMCLIEGLCFIAIGVGGR